MGNSNVTKQCESCKWTTTKLDLERCKRCKRVSQWIVKRRPKSTESAATIESIKSKSNTMLAGESSTGSMMNLFVPNSFGNSRMFQVDRINTPKNAAVRSPSLQVEKDLRSSKGFEQFTDEDSFNCDTPPPLHNSPSPPHFPQHKFPHGMKERRRSSGSNSTTKERRRSSGSNSTTRMSARRNSKRRNSRRTSTNYLEEASRTNRRMPVHPSSLRQALVSSDSSLASQSSSEETLPVGLQRKKRRSLRHKESAEIVHGKFFQTEDSFGGGKDDSMRQNESVESLKHTSMGRTVFQSVQSDIERQEKDTRQHTLGRHHQLHRAALSVNSIMRQWQHHDKLVARAWHTWVTKYRAFKEHERVRNNLKEQFLPPPYAVTALIEGSCDYHNDDLMKKLIREACDWLIRALGVSYVVFERSVRARSARISLSYSYITRSWNITRNNINRAFSLFLGYA